MRSPLSCANHKQNYKDNLITHQYIYMPKQKYKCHKKFAYIVYKPKTIMAKTKQVQGVV